MMNAILTVLMIAVCVQCTLASNQPSETRPRRRIIYNSPPPADEPVAQVRTQSQNWKFQNVGGNKPLAVIEGAKGKIKLDGKVVRENDDEFKKGSIRVRIYLAAIYINDKKIFQGTLTQNSGNDVIFETYPTSFKMNIFKNGSIVYTDNTGSNTYASL